MDWIVTIPKTISWDMYKRELATVERENAVLNYRVAYKPRAKVGEKMYIVHDGLVRGYMYISSIDFLQDFKCSTTGRNWRPGWYIRRKGKFHYLDKPIEMVGFRGLRRFNEGEANT